MALCSHAAGPISGPKPATGAADAHDSPWPSLAAEDLFARVVEASPTALVLVRQSGQIEMVNGQAERVFGYGRAELYGALVELLVPERSYLGDVGLGDAFLIDMSARMLGVERVLLGRRKDGSEFPMELGINRIDIDGQPMVLAAIIDISTRHKLEREKEQQRFDLARSNADLEEFAYAASHDLKAPLRAISHLADWIAEDIQQTATPETLENIALLKARAARMQMLLDGLLAYAHADYSTAVAEPVDIAALVADVVDLMAPPKGFTVAIEGPLPVLHTPRPAIRLVLENLIGNAVKHHDRATGRISVSARPLDSMTEFRVSDDGPGIDARFHEKIFTMFQTLETRDDVESSGIGLAMVKKKVLRHGGRIQVESAPPTRGATFVFTWMETSQ